MSTGAVVRKPPKKETAVRERVRMPQALSDFCLERLHNFEMSARVLLMGKFLFCSVSDFNDLPFAEISHLQPRRDPANRQDNVRRERG